MAQGYLYSLTLDGREFSFKSITYDERPTNINVAQRLLSDGSVNQGFNENEGDLRQLVWTCEELMDDDADTGNLNDLNTYDAGTNYRTSTFSIAYNDVEIYSGTGFYVADVSGRGSIPGEAAFRMSFESIGSGYQKFGDDLATPDDNPGGA